MTHSRIVFGLLDSSRLVGDKRLANQLRELTITWSRYGYQGPIIERDTVDGILTVADQAGFSYCLIQPYGWILSERWQVGGQHSGDFWAALDMWVDANEFLVTGSIVGDTEAWYGFEAGCLLVDLNQYRRLSRPAFDVVCDRPKEMPCALAEIKNGQIAALRPSTETDFRCPRLFGWNVIDCSLTHDISVLAFNDDISSRMLNLVATCSSRRDAFMRYAGQGISHYRSDDAHDGLSSDQRALLDDIRVQHTNARRGVFLWNIESYADVEAPREDWPSPVSTLYSVAAGFKPNRMLQTHGFAEDTKVVFFDYSPAALEIRKCLVDQWDGREFPRFVKYLFQKFPHPETFYQLWNNATPNDLNWVDVESIWERELNCWGGSTAFREHWQAYRKLEHEYICCDIMSDPSALLSKVGHQPHAIVWWSNAFFTMYGNWLYSIEQRKQAYDHWIEQLASRNPDLDLFGSDYNNTSVNFVQAADYWDQYRQSGVDCLTPFKRQRTEIRM